MRHLRCVAASPTGEWYCTEALGHDGPHVARVGPDGPELARWGDHGDPPTRAQQQRATLMKDAQALSSLAMAVWVAAHQGDRPEALVRLNELRELARHAFAMAQSWKAEP